MYLGINLNWLKFTSNYLVSLASFSTNRDCSLARFTKTGYNPHLTIYIILYGISIVHYSA